MECRGQPAPHVSRAQDDFCVIRADAVSILGPSAGGALRQGLQASKEGRAVIESGVVLSAPLDLPGRERMLAWREVAVSFAHTREWIDLQSAPLLAARRPLGGVVWADFWGKGVTARGRAGWLGDRDSCVPRLYVVITCGLPIGLDVSSWARRPSVARWVDLADRGVFAQRGSQVAGMVPHAHCCAGSPRTFGSGAARNLGGARCPIDRHGKHVRRFERQGATLADAFLASHGRPPTASLAGARVRGAQIAPPKSPGLPGHRVGLRGWVHSSPASYGGGDVDISRPSARRVMCLCDREGAISRVGALAWCMRILVPVLKRVSFFAC